MGSDSILIGKIKYPLFDWFLFIITLSLLYVIQMKKIVFLILSFTFCLNISGQQINQSNNRYRGNDVLEKEQVTEDSRYRIIKIQRVVLADYVLN
jgi:hypothetical protein